ncbi:MAG: lipopolysaccharide heptosyltransferase II [Verrucomicrobia bacterium]|nr:lipopolysaccharide heptosyltransferase II [Verrucomicrobiota bacterium]
MKILILKPSSLGDVIQALPVLRLLKLHYPRSEIYWWIEASLVSLLKSDPDLTGLFAFERKRWSSPLKWNELFRSVREMRRHKFDLVIDLQGLARSGAFAWLANGNTLVGVGDPREGAPGFYDVSVPRASYGTHAVDWYLSVLKQLNIPVDRPYEWLPVNDYAKAIVDQQRARHERYILINPGARWMNKRWPAEHFAALVKNLAAEYPDFGFVITGAGNESAVAESIEAAAPERCINVAGRTSLVEMVEWIRGCSVMVTNDTGPMHLAAALGKTVLALFGPTEAARTGPYGQSHNVLRTSIPCAPCMKNRCSNPNYLECLRSITPEFVQEQIRLRLKNAGAEAVHAE